MAKRMRFLIEKLGVENEREGMKVNTWKEVSDDELIQVGNVAVEKNESCGQVSRGHTRDGKQNKKKLPEKFSKSPLCRF